MLFSFIFPENPLVNAETKTENPFPQAGNIRKLQQESQGISVLHVGELELEHLLHLPNEL